MEKELEQENESGFQPCDDEIDNHPFAQIPNDLIRDSSLSPNCRWFISYFLSHSGKWNLSIPYVMKTQKISKDKMYSIVNQALASGYVKREEFFVKGRKCYKYYVSRLPRFKKSLPCPEIQDTENQDTREYQNKSKDLLKEHQHPHTPSKGADDAVSFETLKKGLKDKEKADRALAFYDKHKEYVDSNAKTTPLAYLVWLIQNDKDLEPDFGRSKLSTNKELLKKVADKFPNHDEIEILDIGINFKWATGSLTIITSEHGFRDQVINRLRKMGLDVTGL